MVRRTPVDDEDERAYQVAFVAGDHERMAQLDAEAERRREKAIDLMRQTGI